MRVFVLGGTGFVGGYVIEELEHQGYDVVSLVRSGSEHKLPLDFQGEKIVGDVFNFTVPSNCEAVIHMIGIVREYKRKGVTFEKLQFLSTKNAVDSTLDAGIKRFILLSANGVKPEGTRYQSTKHAAEECVKSQRFDWTIFRPSIIFGNPDCPSGPVGKLEFCTMLLKQMIDPPFPAPLFYSGLKVRQAGEFTLQPIHVKDIARGMVASLTQERSYGKIYHVGGNEVYTWKEIINIIAETVGKTKWKLPVPAWGVKCVASLMDWIPVFPISKDQVSMLMEGNTCESIEFFRDFFERLQEKNFGIPFVKENLSYLKSESG